MNNSLPELKERLVKAESRLAKINQKSGTEKYLEEVAKHFHLGMVGGSGKNNRKLDQKRGAAADKAIDRAVESTELVREIEYLKRQKKNPNKIIEDLQKAAWYINHEMERMGR